MHRRHAKHNDPVAQRLAVQQAILMLSLILLRCQLTMDVFPRWLFSIPATRSTRAHVPASLPSRPPPASLLVRPSGPNALVTATVEAKAAIKLASSVSGLPRGVSVVAASVVAVTSAAVVGRPAPPSSATSHPLWVRDKAWPPTSLTTEGGATHPPPAGRRPAATNSSPLHRSAHARSPSPRPPWRRRHRPLPLPPPLPPPVPCTTVTATPAAAAAAADAAVSPVDHAPGVAGVPGGGSGGAPRDAAPPPRRRRRRPPLPPPPPPAAAPPARRTPVPLPGSTAPAAGGGGRKPPTTRRRRGGGTSPSEFIPLTAP